MRLSVILYNWSKCDGERQSQLKEWLDDAITQCASNNGLNLASTSANGVSVAFMSNSLTIVDWMGALSEALQMLDTPAKSQRKAIQIFR